MWLSYLKKCSKSSNVLGVNRNLEAVMDAKNVAIGKISHIFICPICYGDLIYLSDQFICNQCKREFNVDNQNKILSLVRPFKQTLISKINEDWSNHFENSSKIFQVITRLLRRFMLAPILKNALKKDVIGRDKIFLEAGSGLSETSILLDLDNHAYISLDISDYALLNSYNSQVKLQGDLFNIPIKNEVVDIIFNVGVHEHYSDKDNEILLTGFNKVLKNEGKIVLLWPYYFGPLMIITKLVNLFLSFILNKKFELYPNQNYEIKNFNNVNALIEKCGFKYVEHYKSFFDIFSTVVLVYKKVN